MFKQLVCAILCLSLVISAVACTNDRAMVRPTANQVVNKVEVGDHVRIHAKNGQTYAVEVIEVASNYLRGEDMDTGKRYRIPVSQIDVMVYEELSPGKTAAAAIGGVYLAWMAAMLVVIYAIAGSDFGDSWNGGGGC